MSNTLWTASIRITDHLVQPDSHSTPRLPPVTRPACRQSLCTQPGKLLQLMARMVGARRILEIGTLAGYRRSGWHVRSLRAVGSLRGARIASCRGGQREYSARGTRTTGGAPVGRASDTLADLVAEQAGPFDLTSSMPTRGIPEYFRRRCSSRESGR